MAAKVTKLDPKVELEVMPPANLSADDSSFRYNLDSSIQKAETEIDNIRKALGEKPGE